MIVINCAMMQDKFTEAIQASSLDLKFIKKEGMQLCFETSGDEKSVAAAAKAYLKSCPDFKALYYQVNVK
ncbi:hypothetical protein [Fusibacter ferrireducens]|uniref:Uncharacterized protein n=1 Tax=Fusibacter ferrireducens TaxID=2785058 RepID=A0ABR9ZS97_9FIRM|nr:hypothetical protein [Fusibacter ferrireducens]MBF4693216.1 hypothetical protein [Fusibacter ferrireducens]